MPCSRGLHSLVVLPVTPHECHEVIIMAWARSEGGAPSVGERSSEMVTNATNCRDCQPLMDLQRWETSDRFVITDVLRWAVLWKFYLNHDNYNELLTHQSSQSVGTWQTRISSNLFMHSPSPAIMIEQVNLWRYLPENYKNSKTR